MDKIILTCALNGVLTDPRTHPVPVTPAEMASSAREAFEQGATIMHIHFRDQRPNCGHLPSWEPDNAAAITAAIRAACPGVIINQTTGVVGSDVSGPIACMERSRPEIAACNAGSLNYLKLREDGTWAWPPMLFDNPVAKISKMLEAGAKFGILPEFECFDLGIVRSVELYRRAGMMRAGLYNLVLGVASGMPVDKDVVDLCRRFMPASCHWQATLIGRAEIWPVHQHVAEQGGMLRTGLEDSFFLPDGRRARGNGDLIAALARCAQHAARAIASPSEARALLGLPMVDEAVSHG
ncbi:3-keto-5-aminohexanoate cleavage enzyme [Acidiphilium sp. MT5]